MIVSFVDNDHSQWDQYLPEFRFAYNSAYHTSLKSSPAFFNFGRDPAPTNSLHRRKRANTEVESQDPTSWVERMRKIQVLREWVIKNLDDAFMRQSKYYNLRRRQLHFSKGDLVLSRCRTPSSKIKNVAAKLCPKFLGPYRVSKVLSQNVYELSGLDHKVIGKSHIEDLKPFVPPNVDPNSDPQVESEK